MKYKEKLSIRVENISLPEYGEDRYQYAKDWMRTRGIKCDCVGWSYLDMDGQNIPELMKDIQESPKNLLFVADQLEQKIEGDDAEWYLLSPSYLQDDCIIGEKPSEMKIRADKIPHRLQIIYNNNIILVSDTFRKACEKHHLTGIQFQWVKDIGKYQAEQFFIPIITNSMGKEMAHPYRDEKKIIFSKEDPDDIRNVKFNAIADEILQRQNTIERCIFNRIAQDSRKDRWEVKTNSYPRFFRQTLPNTDFAYFVDFLGHQEIYISNWAYQCLKAEKILNVLRDIETGVEILDVLPENPKKYSEGKLDKWKQYLNLCKDNMYDYETFMMNPKIKKTVTKKKVLSYIRKLKIDDKSRCSSCAPKKWRIKLEEILPSELLELYSITNHFEISDDIETIAIQDIEKETKEYQENIEDEDIVCEEYKEAGIIYQNGWIFARSYDGDRFLYVDGKVVSVLHETGWSLGQVWHTLYEFLWDFL